MTFSQAAVSSIPPSPASQAEPCDSDDLSCIKHALVDKILEVESLGRQLAVAFEQTRNANELIGIWKEQADRAREASKEAMAALRPSPWYAAPTLWFAVGFTVAAAIVVAVVYAVVPAFRLATQ